VGQQPAAERSARVRAREILRGEAAGVEQRQRERVAQREGRRRARGGREVVRAGLDVDRGVQVSVGGLRERRALVAGEREELRALPLEVRDQLDELVGLAGVRQHHHDVAGGDHAEVAVLRFGRMDEERRRAGRRQRGGELGRDVAGLADARHHHAAPALQDQRDRVDEGLPEAPGQRDDRVGLDREHVARERERARRIDRGRVRCGRGILAGRGDVHPAEYTASPCRRRCS
jgi:hypothetical protein